MTARLSPTDNNCGWQLFTEDASGSGRRLYTDDASGSGRRLYTDCASGSGRPGSSRSDAVPSADTP
jgi:hypothetical protein